MILFFLGRETLRGVFCWKEFLLPTWERGRETGGQGTDIWLLGDLGWDQVNKLAVYLVFDIFICHICKSPFSTLLIYSIWYNEKKYVIDFVVKDFPSWKCICSRPICVEAITAERGNKSVPNEKLPESGQLPPDLQDLPQVTNLFHCSAQELGGRGGGGGLSSTHLLPKTEFRCALIIFLHIWGSDRTLDFCQV